MQRFQMCAAILAVPVILAGCGTPDPVRYRDLESTRSLRINQDDQGGRMPYRYAAFTDWKAYDQMIIDPVILYGGQDHQFGDMSMPDRQELTRYMQGAFAQKLNRRFSLVNSVSERTLRLRLTLTGAETSTPVIAPLSRFDIGGGLYNGVQALRGKEGALTGAVMFAVEIFDSRDNRLLLSYVSKQYPGVYQLGATMGALAAAKAGLDKGAEALVQEFR